MKTEFIAIQDRSGSMGPLCHDVIGGYNSFLAEQRLVAGEARVTCVQFNGDVVTKYQAVPLAEVKDFSDADYTPMGSTALLDAIGITLEQQGKRIAAEGWADMVIVHINTDGEENVSREYSHERIKEMIAHAQDKAGWVFLFQAANQDAFATGGKFGISGATTSNFVASAAGVRDAYGSTSASVTTLRTAGAGPAPGAWLDAIARTPVPLSDGIFNTAAPAQPFGLPPDAIDAGVPLPKPAP